MVFLHTLDFVTCIGLAPHFWLFLSHIGRLHMFLVGGTQIVTYGDKRERNSGWEQQADCLWKAMVTFSCKGARLKQEPNGTITTNKQRQIGCYLAVWQQLLFPHSDKLTWGKKDVSSLCKNALVWFPAKGAWIHGHVGHKNNTSSEQGDLKTAVTASFSKCKSWIWDTRNVPVFYSTPWGVWTLATGSSGKTVVLNHNPLVHKNRFIRH